jgi:hypothetical protein
MGINLPTYYQVEYRRKQPNGVPDVRQVLAICEDVRDAVQLIVSAYRKNPSCAGEFGIEQTPDHRYHKFMRSTYRAGGG